jgi:phage shock protein PspC (stress-responsive transcriptional regulator)
VCGKPVFAPQYGPVPTRFVRPREGRMIAGVCAGLSMAYGWDVAIVRLVVALAILCAGVPIVLYLIAWVVMPNADYLLPPTTGATVS